MSCEVALENISVRFRKHHAPSTRFKEALLRKLSPPKWAKNKSNGEMLWGLKNVDLQLKEGDRLGVLGQNGAGKSTLLKVISRIYKPFGGSVHVKGRIAPLIEIGAGFHPELSGRENIYLNAAILGIPKKVIEKRIPQIIEFAELEESIDMPVKYYSTGMHLRLAFTIATEVPPDILILDELFAGADQHFMDRANVRLDKFVDKSKILILVSHNLEYIERFCNRAIIINHGVIVGEGTPRQMIDQYLANDSH